MAEWRFGRGWSPEELRQSLDGLTRCSVNFRTPFEEMTRKNGWTVERCQSRLGNVARNPAAFRRVKQALIAYNFSDPRIAVAYFDPDAPLRGRQMLLEFRAFGFRFLNGVRIQEVWDEAGERQVSFGYRYDTLEGHVERGSQCFLLTQDLLTGEIRLHIEDRWQHGDFPNWWSKIGFTLVGGAFRRLWRSQIPKRLRRAAEQDRG